MMIVTVKWCVHKKYNMIMTAHDSNDDDRCRKRDEKTCNDDSDNNSNIVWDDRSN